MVGAYKLLVEKNEETRTRWRPVVVGNRILKFERYVKADLFQLVQNSSHWRVLMDTEVYLHSFLHCELSGASISFTIQCPSNRKLDRFGADLDPVEKKCLSRPCRQSNHNSSDVQPCLYTHYVIKHFKH
jgi:hypothetical protein